MPVPPVIQLLVSASDGTTIHVSENNPTYEAVVSPVAAPTVTVTSLPTSVTASISYPYTASVVAVSQSAATALQTVIVEPPAPTTVVTLNQNVVDFARFAPSSSLAETASVARVVDFTGIQNLPALVSSSTQVDYTQLAGIPTDLFRTGSHSTTNITEGTKLFYTDGRVKTKLNVEGVISSSAQVTYGSLQNIPTDLFRYETHNSSLIIEGSKLFYTDGRVKTFLNTLGVISGSNQVQYAELSGVPSDIFRTGSHTTTNITEGLNLFFKDSRVKAVLDATAVLSGSVRYIDLVGIPADIFRTGSHSTTNVTEGSNLYFTPTRVKTVLDANGLYSSSVQIKPILDAQNIVSSSVQIKSVLNVEHVVSSSAQITFAGLSGVPSDLFRTGSNSTNDIIEGTKLFYSDTRVKTKLNNDGVVSSSAQIIYSGLTDVPGDLFHTGSHSTTNITEGINLFYTDARVKTKLNTEGVVSSSAQVLFSGITGKPALVSSSAQIIYSDISEIPADLFRTGSHSTTNITEGTKLFYTDVRVKNKLNQEGVVSSSAQVLVSASQVIAGAFGAGISTFPSASKLGINVIPVEALHVSGNVRVDGVISSSNGLIVTGPVNLPIGSVADIALSSNIPLKNAISNVFVGEVVFDSGTQNNSIKHDGIRLAALSKVEWGATANGSASVKDTNLYRIASGTLNTDGKFVVGQNLLVSGSVVVLGSASLGGWQFALSGDTGTVTGASGGNPALELSGSGLSKIYYPAGASLIVYERNGSDKLFISSAGVGIGTISPARSFHVAGATRFGGSIIELTTNGRLYFAANNPSHSIGYTTGSNGVSLDSTTLDLSITGTNKVRLNAAGLGIGVASPSASLHVGGNVEIDGPLTASIVSASNVTVSALTASVINEGGVNLDQKYLLNTGGVISGSLIISGSLTANEFHTTFVSSSVIYQSGSTKFGDTTDDVMSVTGSLQISGSLIATGTIIGDIQGSSISSVSSSYASQAGSVDYADVANKPALVSSSAQISFTGISSKPTLVSSSAQINYFGLANLPGDLFRTGSHSTTNIAEGANLFYTDARVKSKLNVEGVVSSSAQINYSALTGIPADIFRTGSHSTTNITEGTKLFYTDARVKAKLDTESVISSSAQVAFSGISGKPALVSGSAQIDFAGISNKPALVSSSAQVNYTGLSNVPTDIFRTGSHSTTNITEGSNLYYTDARVKTKLNVDGVVSSSAQINYAALSNVPGDLFRTGSHTTTNLTEGLNLFYTDVRVKNKLNADGIVSSSVQIDYSGLSNVPGDLFRTGSYTTSNITEGSNFFYTDARVKTKLNADGVVSSSNQIDFTGIINKPTLVSSSVQISFTGISNVPALVSSSTQIDFTGIINKPTLVSSSAQISFAEISNVPFLVSSSGQIVYSGLTGVPGDIFRTGSHSTTNITEGTKLFYTDVRVKTKLNTDSVVSSSAQINASGISGTLNDGTLSTNVPLKTTANVFSQINTFNGLIVTGSVTITGTVNAASIVETSTLRRKKNITDQTSQLSNVLKLRPVEFTWKDTEKRDKGLIAEEVATVYPEFVAFETVDGESVPAAVNYSKMVSVLIQTVQELNERIEVLEGKKTPGFWKKVKSRLFRES